MEQIIIHRHNGNPDIEVLSEYPFRTATSAKLQMQHMANDYVQLTMQCEEKFNLGIGDYVEVNGRRYSIRSVSDINMLGEDNFTYTITFYGVMYDLMRYQFRNTSLNGRSTTATCDLTQPLKGFINLVVYNANQRAGNTTWAFDENAFDTWINSLSSEKRALYTTPKTMSFDKQNCLTALQNICKEFDVEFLIGQGDVSGVWMKTIQVGQFGTWINQSNPFEYGMGEGLYQLQESKVDDGTIINRLWAEGGSDNVLSGYRGYSSRVQLPLFGVPRSDDTGATVRRTKIAHTINIGGTDKTFPIGTVIGITDDEKRYIDEPVLVSRSNDSHNPAILDPYNSQDLIGKYGVIEDTAVFDDIVPRKTFTILSVDANNSRCKFTCDIDFNLNAKWLLNYNDFLEWCRLKTTIIPTPEQYQACIDYVVPSGNTSSWNHYREYIACEVAFDDIPMALAEFCDDRGYTYTPVNNFSQEVYEKYCEYKSVVNGNNSKYVFDSAQVVFVDGKLAGQTLTIASSSFSNATHRTTITLQWEEEPDTGTQIPSEDEFGAFRFAIGDKFKLVNIYMPYSYYEDAEEELWFAAYEKFEEIKYAKYQYRLTFDQFFVEENSTVFAAIKPGDYVGITDSRFGLTNKKMRITGVDVNLMTGRDYTLTLESVHKNRTRYGINITQAYQEIYRAIEDVRLDDPEFRRGNRVNAMHTINRLMDGNGHLRPVRVGDSLIVERMIANDAVTTNKILANAITAAKIYPGAVTLDRLASVVAQKIVLAEMFVNNGSTNDRHYQGTVTFADNVLSLHGTKFIDSYSKARLGYNTNEWACSADIDIDFSDGYDTEKPYVVMAQLNADGTCEYLAVVKGEENSEEYASHLKIGEVSEDNGGVRTYTPYIGETYMQDGVLKDGADNTILDIKNGVLRGLLKFSGLKDGSNNDLDIVSLLGGNPTSGLRGVIGADDSHGLRFSVGDLIDKVGEDAQDVGGLLYRAAQLESGRSTHMGKINELIDSIYSANQILLSIQSNFNTMRSQLLNRQLINQSGDSGTVSELGIGHCTYNPIQQQEQCVVDPAGIGVPTRLQN